MHKLFSLLLISILLYACSTQNTPAPTIASISSPTVTAIPPLSITKEIKLETQTGTTYTLAWSSHGNLLAVASGGEITILNSDLEIQNIFKPENGVLGVTWNLEKNVFATVNGFRNPFITLWEWNAENLTQTQQIQADADQYGIAWSPNGEMFATLASDSKSIIQIWDASTFEKTDAFDLPYTKPRRTLQWSLDNSKVFGSGKLNGQAVFFSINISNGTVNELANFPPSEAEVFSIDSNEQWLAIASPNGILQIIDLKTKSSLAQIKTVNQPADIAWHPKNNTLAILDYQTTLQLWQFIK